MNRNASPVAALQQAERILAARVLELGELFPTGGLGSFWVEYAALTSALAIVMGQTRGWTQRGPYRRTGPAAP